MWLGLVYWLAGVMCWGLLVRLYGFVGVASRWVVGLIVAFWGL